VRHLVVVIIIPPVAEVDAFTAPGSSAPAGSSAASGVVASRDLLLLALVKGGPQLRVAQVALRAIRRPVLAGCWSAGFHLPRHELFGGEVVSPEEKHSMSKVRRPGTNRWRRLTAAVRRHPELPAVLIELGHGDVIHMPYHLLGR
jgi:hypothetical protein